MWELYAMWAWIPIFLVESLKASGDYANLSGILTGFIFLIFFLGAIATFVLGILAEKIGKIKMNIALLALSGLSGITIGFFFGGAQYLVIGLAIFWGIVAVADSAQYSAMIADEGNKKLMGSALTLELAGGFLISMISILLIPIVESYIGWKYAFMILAIGPIIGIISLLNLKKRHKKHKF